MAKFLTRIRFIVGALALTMMFAFGVPASAQQPSSVNPTADAVKEQQLLQQLRIISGRGTIPDTKSYNIEQPRGRDWQYFHQVTLKWIGGIFILGMVALLTVFFLIRGRMRIEDGWSGRLVTRFNALDRFSHWLMAVSFIILGITGLNITFGKQLLLPLIGPEAFSTWSLWAKYAHNYFAAAFVVGVLLAFLLWVKDNFPTKADVEWLKEGGGMIGHAHPPAWKFNAGQKLLFWFVVFGTITVTASGYLLLFPFYYTDIFGMQLAEVVHGVIAMLFIALIIAHIYIGTLGMEGAYDAMGTGQVDLNWAKQHHPLWVQKEHLAEKSVPAAPGQQPTPSATPAE